MQAFRRIIAVILASLAGVTAVTLTDARAQAGGDRAVEAAKAAQAWATVIKDADVDGRMELLPPTTFARPGERERTRARLMKDREIAQANRDRITVFAVQAPIQTYPVGKYTVVVFPYRSERIVGTEKFTTQSSLIAFSEEGSSKWWVFDGSGQNPRSLKALIPGHPGQPLPPPATTSAVKQKPPE